MTIVQYLKEQAQQLTGTFKNLKVRITYNDLSDTHFLELHPEAKYDDEVKLSASYILEDFYIRFPNDCLSFVTVSDLIDSTVGDQWVYGDKYIDWSSWFKPSLVGFEIEPIVEGEYILAA